MKFEKLGNIADIIAGQSPPSSTYNSEGNGIPFFQGKADYGEKYPTVRYWCTEPTKISLPDDILISMRAPVGPVNINTVESCIGRGLSAIRVKKNVSRDFIYFWLKQNQHIIAAKETGSTFKAITQKILNEIVVPFPSYPIQLHIANLLSKAENLIAQRKESIRLLDEFLKSTFLEMFGDPVRNGKGWDVWNLSELGSLDRGVSKARPRNSPELLGGIYPLIQTGDVTNAGIYITSYKQTYSELGMKQSKLWPKGTMLITIAANIAQTSILSFDACFPDSVVGFVTNTKKARVLYVHFLFKFFQALLESKASQTAQKNINLDILRNLKVPCPPIELQTQFAQIVEKTEALKTQYQQSLQELENLYGSLSQKAFRGELGLKEESLLSSAERSLSEVEVSRRMVAEPNVEYKTNC